MKERIENCEGIVKHLSVQIDLAHPLNFRDFFTHNFFDERVDFLFLAVEPVSA